MDAMPSVVAQDLARQRHGATTVVVEKTMQRPVGLAKEARVDLVRRVGVPESAPVLLTESAYPVWSCPKLPRK